MSKVGFLHDKNLKRGDILSETDAESKYNIDVEHTTDNAAGDNEVELSIADFDETVVLDVDGTLFKCLRTGPILDKHSNYKNYIFENDFSLGVSRFAIRDRIDTEDYKSTDEYWSLYEYNTVTKETDEANYDALHSDGTVLMRSYVVWNASNDYAEVYVKTRDEDTGIWSSGVLVDTVKTKFSSSQSTAPKGSFVTIPGFGTLLFYFGIQDDAVGGTTNYNKQVVYIAATKDNGQSWSRYSSFVLQPYHGGVLPDSTDFYIDRINCNVKAEYYNNKIILALMLSGTDVAASEPREQHFQKNDADADTDTAVVDVIEDKLFRPDDNLKIVPGSVYVWQGEPGIGNVVAQDDSDGNFVLEAAYIGDMDLNNSYVDYDTFDIKLEELTAALFGEDITTSECWVKYTLDGLHLKRILNVMYSNDIGKSWITIPTEFISQTIEGPLPNSNYLLGDEEASFPLNSYPYGVPGNFALGYEPSADKVVLVLRSSGTYTLSSPPVLSELNNISNLYFFYNVDDEMLKWESSRVTGKSYKIADGFSIDRINDLWEEYRKTGIVGTPNWFVEGGYLYQTGDVDPPTPPAFPYDLVVDGGTILYFDKHDDPTLNRTVGFHIDLNSSSDGNFGIKFCDDGSDGNYAIGINTYNDTATIGFKKWDGVSAYVDVPSTTEQKLNFSKNSWGSIDVIFKDVADILVFFDGVLIYTGTDNDFRVGKIGLFCTGQYGAIFDNFAFYPSVNALNIIGGTRKSGAVSDYYGIGTNIDIAVDQYNQSWIASDVHGIDLESTIFSEHGSAFQKFRLEKDFERVEGKFLAKEKYVVKFSDNEYFQEDAGEFLSIRDYGIMPASVNDKKAMLNSFVWHKGNPFFDLFRQYSGSPVKAIAEKTSYSNRSMYNNMSSSWSLMNGNGEPEESGFEVTGTYAVISYLIIDELSDIFQEYNFTTDTFSTNAIASAPVRYFDLLHKGVFLFVTSRGYTTNDFASSRYILEVTTPYLNVSGGGNDLRSIIRVKVTDETSSGLGDGIVSVEYYNGTVWNSFGTLAPFDTDNWFDLSVFIVPTGISQPIVSVYAREHATRSEWQIVSEGYATATAYASTGDVTAKVRFGAMDSAGGSSKQEFKFAGYSDMCFMDPSQDPIRGETAQSGENIYGTQSMVMTVGGGMPVEGDEWTITDLTNRKLNKDNLLDRQSVVWRTDDDDVNKSVVFDTGQIMEYDSFIVTGVNCRYIWFESNDEDVWTSPNTRQEIDMTEYSDVYIEKYTGKEQIVRIIRHEDDFPKDFLLDRVFLGQNPTHGTYRVRANHGRHMIYESVHADSIPAGKWLVKILGKSVAFRFDNRKRDRYFRITCRNSGLTYPTPENYFQLSQFSVGVFDELQWNPEYPEEIKFNHHVKRVKSAGGSLKYRKFAPMTKERSLKFNSVDNNQRGFAEQLISIFRHSGGESVFYVPNIGELEETGIGTYTFDVMQSYLNTKLKHNLKWGSLSDIALILKESL